MNKALSGLLIIILTLQAMLAGGDIHQPHLDSRAHHDANCITSLEGGVVTEPVTLSDSADSALNDEACEHCYHSHTPCGGLVSNLCVAFSPLLAVSPLPTPLLLTPKNLRSALYRPPIA